MRQLGTLFVTLVLLAPTVGCSNFNKEWTKAASLAAPGDRLTGRWKGSWKSDKSGHNGGLMCVARPAGADKYRLRFEATYLWLLHFGYTLTTEADPQDLVTYVTGEADLGSMAGGKYEYEGHADGRVFYLNYKTNQGDFGHFSLRRVN